jgi:hypothetical protein
MIPVSSVSIGLSDYDKICMHEFSQFASPHPRIGM